MSFTYAIDGVWRVVWKGITLHAEFPMKFMADLYLRDLDAAPCVPLTDRFTESLVADAMQGQRP